MKRAEHSQAATHAGAHGRRAASCAALPRIYAVTTVAVMALRPN